MAAPKRTKAQRDLDIQEMVKLIRRGHTQREIAAKLGLARSQIAYDWKKVLVEVNADRPKDVGVILAQYRELKAEAWEAWERSKKDRERETTEAQSGTGSSKPKTKATKSKEGRLPEAEYLKVVVKCLEAERTLENLDPAKSVKLGGDPANPLVVEVVETVVTTREDIAKVLAAHPTTGSVP